MIPVFRSPSRPNKTLTLLAVCLGTFMLIIDVQIVVVALPSIRTALHTSFSDEQWTIDAYSLSLAALLLPAGSLADILGRRRVFARRAGRVHRRVAAVRRRRIGR